MAKSSINNSIVKIKWEDVFVDRKWKQKNLTTTSPSDDWNWSFSSWVQYNDYWPTANVNDKEDRTLNDSGWPSYWGWWGFKGINYLADPNPEATAARSASVAPVTQPIVKSIVQPWAKRYANDAIYSQWLSEDEKRRRGIVNITSEVQPTFDWSTNKFNQWQLTSDQLRARYEADLASWASQEQLQREYWDMWAPAWMWAF